MSERRLMKEGLNRDAIKRISTVLQTIENDFATHEFIEEAVVGITRLELKQRVSFIITVLAKYLPTDFTVTAEILLKVKDYWDWGDPDDPLSSFAAWPLIDYVAVYGLEDPKRSLAVLKQLTPLFTAEFAIRPFIKQHFSLTYTTLVEWSEDQDEHVRRLVSEGIRPRLPWGKQLTQFRDDPEPIIVLLERLKDDPSRYVRRSVANNLNDISKDHSERVIQLCQAWSVDASDNRQWIIRHGCRSLIKLGESAVFSILGFTENPQFSLENFSIVKNQIKLGESLGFLLTIKSESAVGQHLMVDYKIHHVKANQTCSSKVFKLSTIRLETNDKINIKKNHPFKQISTRKYYSGRHSIELIINGKTIDSLDFTLSVP